MGNAFGRIAGSAAIMMFALALAGCETVSRLSAVPEAQTKQATILGIPNARYIMDETPPSALIEEFVQSFEREAVYLRSVKHKGPLPSANYLAVSGGGDNGAFGAGFLIGWSERGRRPSFKAVTGISTGALIAPFAFLGPEYDQSLTDVFTKTDQKDIYAKRPVLAALSEDGMADTKPLFGLITRYMDDPMIERIAREYDRGRLLLIATTNLDASKAVIWNIGAIAKSGHPQAPDLIRRVLLASASIPGAFPPVLFEVQTDGKTHQELHGDGGVMAQTFLYPPSVSMRGLAARARAVGINPGGRKRTAYIIRNGKLSDDWKEVEPKTLTLAGRAVSQLIASNGVGDMYRIYETTRRDGVGFNLAFIDRDFDVPYPEPFDRGYMNKLFDYGKAKALTGDPWRKQPPGFVQ
jgi:predicted acylesterase/phospholipase RssA